MKKILELVGVMVFLVCQGCKNAADTGIDGIPDSTLFPAELVQFRPYVHNPVFSGTGNGTWDEVIRERGFILKESDGYHMWYTGHRKDRYDTLSLGYATSVDGVVWTRHPGNPVYDSTWTEDMMVVREGDVYYMFAEGRGDTAHMLSSRDRINWQDHGALKIFYTDGRPLSAGPYGTPTAWKEDSTWYLFYERNDSAIWLAKSTDLQQWTNVQDDPVIDKGPADYDRFGVALNQVIKRNGLYYGYYHGTAMKDWSEWSTNVAVSKDLRRWKKFGGNPIMQQNKSSGILIDDGTRLRLYTMHPEVHLHYSEKPK